MKLDVLTDVYLCPPGTAPDGWQNPYAFDRGDALLAEAIAVHRTDGVDALAVLGDLADSGDASSLGRAVRLLADADLPAWVTGGNHDREEDDGLLESLVREAPLRLRMALPFGQSAAGIRVIGVLMASPDGELPWFVEAG